MQRLIKTFFLISLFAAWQLAGIELKAATPASDMIEVESDRLDVNKAKGQAIFMGNVKAVQGDILIKGATLTLFFDDTAKKINKMIADKNVFIRWEEKESTCDKAVYTLPDKVLELTGNVVITRGEERVSGQRVIIDTITDHQVVEGGTGGRVRLRMNSGKESGVLEWKK